jgi:hypothetical protein
MLLLFFLLAPFALYLAVTQAAWFKANLRPGDRALGLGSGVLVVVLVAVVTLGSRPIIGAPIGFILFVMSAPFTLTSFMLAVTFVVVGLRRRRSL